MKPKRSRRYAVVIVCAVWRGARRLRAAVAPRWQGMLAVVVRVSGCSGTRAESVAGHVVLAALGAGALALAGAFVGAGGWQLLDLAGVLSVSAIALHAVFVVVQGPRGSARPLGLRPLLARALAQVPAARARVPAARALALACEPQQFWHELDLPNAATRYAFRALLSRLELPSVTSALPGLGQLLRVSGACQASLASARFVRELALAANEIHVQAALAGNDNALLLAAHC